MNINNLNDIQKTDPNCCSTDNCDPCGNGGLTLEQIQIAIDNGDLVDINDNTIDVSGATAGGSDVTGVSYTPATDTLEVTTDQTAPNDSFTATIPTPKEFVIITDTSLATNGSPVITDITTFITANSLVNTNVYYVGGGSVQEPDYIWNVSPTGAVLLDKEPITSSAGNEHLPQANVVAVSDGSDIVVTKQSNGNMTITVPADVTSFQAHIPSEYVGQDTSGATVDVNIKVVWQGTRVFNQSNQTMRYPVAFDFYNRDGEAFTTFDVKDEDANPQKRVQDFTTANEMDLTYSAVDVATTATYVLAF